MEKQTFYDLVIDHSRELVSTACQDRMIRLVLARISVKIFIDRIVLEFTILKMENEFEHAKVQ